MITVVPRWAKSGFRSNLRASNLQNFPGGAYSHTPLACVCVNRLPPKSQMSSATVEKCLGVKLGVDSECQSDTPTTEPCTMTLWQSMNHYVRYT